MTLRSILVTGGLGFVGGHLLEMVAQLPLERLVVLDDKSSKSPRAPRVDTTRFHLVSEMEELSRPNLDFDVVIHAAARADIRRNVREAKRIYQSNVMLTRK